MMEMPPIMSGRTSIRSATRERQVPEDHRCDRRHCIRFKEVRRHAGAIANVVAHIVRDDRRVPRIVFRDPRFHFAHEVRADIRAFREDAAAQPREDGDQASPEAEPDERAYVMRRSIETRDREQRKANHEKSRHRAAFKRDAERFRESRLRRLRRLHIRAHRDVHADIARERGSERADHKSRHRGQAEEYSDQNGDDDRDNRNRFVLPVQICFRADLDRVRDLLHFLIARRCF